MNQHREKKWTHKKKKKNRIEVLKDENELGDSEFEDWSLLFPVMHP